MRATSMCRCPPELTMSIESATSSQRSLLTLPLIEEEPDSTVPDTTSRTYEPPFIAMSVYLLLQFNISLYLTKMDPIVWAVVNIGLMAFHTVVFFYRKQKQDIFPEVCAICALILLTLQQPVLAFSVVLTGGVYMGASILLERWLEKPGEIIEENKSIV